ncbi:MAG: helix-turn-helix domain-containing protein, partial [Thermoplasmata archaeon]
MLEEKMVFEIQIFHSEGLSISAIARRLGIAPNTVKKYLTKERCQMEKHSKLDPFKSYIISRLNEYPEITSVVLLKEINARGYTGKITTLRCRISFFFQWREICSHPEHSFFLVLK